MVSVRNWSANWGAKSTTLENIDPSCVYRPESMPKYLCWQNCWIAQQPLDFGRSRRTRNYGLSKAGLMLFMQLDHGAVVRKETGREIPKMIRLVIGNPLILKEMAKHVPDAGSYAPVTVPIDERSDGVHLSYDRMSSFLAPYRNHDALQVTPSLDQKVEDLLRQAAA